MARKKKRTWRDFTTPSGVGRFLGEKAADTFGPTMVAYGEGEEPSKVIRHPFAPGPVIAGTAREAFIGRPVGAPAPALTTRPSVAPGIAPSVPIAAPSPIATAPTGFTESRTPSGGYLGLPAETAPINWGESREELSPALRAERSVARAASFMGGATQTPEAVAASHRRSQIMGLGIKSPLERKYAERDLQRTAAQPDIAAQRDFELKKAGIALGAEVPQEKVATIRREMQEDATAGGQVTNMWNKMVSQGKTTGRVNQITGEPERVPYSAQEQADLWEQAKATVLGKKPETTELGKATTVAEGTTVVNPATCERMIARGGKWVKA